MPAQAGIQKKIKLDHPVNRHAPVYEPGNDKEEIATPRKARLATTTAF